jgi:hypothetical protein
LGNEEIKFSGYAETFARRNYQYAVKYAEFVIPALDKKLQGEVTGNSTMI